MSRSTTSCAPDPRGVENQITEKAPKMKLIINERECEIETPQELARELARFDGQQYREIWLNVEDGPALSALLNGNRGWLMYLRESGDPGFSSRSPGYDGPAESTIPYRLGNGRVDEHPESWALDIGLVEKALAFFVKTAGAADFVTWHNDSEDGQSAPMGR